MAVLITTGTEGEVHYVYEYSCSDQGDNVTFTCESMFVKGVNITAGIYDDSVRSATPTAKLEETWSAFNSELSIEGRPVNLPAFGYFETQHPILGRIRFWSVVIAADKPGKINFSDSGMVDGEPYNSITTYNFSLP